MTSSAFLTDIGDEMLADAKRATQQELLTLVDPDQYIGDLITLDYDHADILVHDTHRNRNNGLPHGCLLLATRITPADLSSETVPGDPYLLLIRVAESVKLSTDTDLDKVRFEAVQRSNDTQYSYDESKQTDQFTLNLLRYSGIRCRILGTFLLYQSSSEDDWTIHFGSDIANFNAGQGMKIYKPTDNALEAIVNFHRDDEEPSASRKVARLRYSSAIKEDSTPESAPVSIRARDFIAQRTALFGMTRSGKSNTTKIIASALFGLRIEEPREVVGQLIFDPNGEYANDNPQDQGCLRNVQYERSDYFGQVHTYGLHEHPFDKKRHITKFNFYGNQEPSSPPAKREELDHLLQGLYQGKQIIDDALVDETGGYIQDFRNSSVADSAGVTGSNARGEYTRFRRRLFIYRCILAEAGFEAPQFPPSAQGLFSKQIRNLMSDSADTSQYAELLENSAMSWDVAGNFVRAFAAWVQSDDFKTFDRDYAAKKQGRNWSDTHLRGLLRFFDNTRGRAVARNAVVWHAVNSADDYADTIVRQVRDGNLVIVDQLLGDPDLNRQAAERIVKRLFGAQQQSFVTPVVNETTGEIIRPPHVIIYAEEAHTLLPKSSEDDNTNIWARIAKEGAKFNIGLVYSTQEPSSIQTNILKNTENWFIAHLNNTDETNQLNKFNDFKDFASSIINVSEAGLIKMRTRSSYFTIPVQMDEFKAPAAPPLSSRSNWHESGQQRLPSA